MKKSLVLTLLLLVLCLPLLLSGCGTPVGGVVPEQSSPPHTSSTPNFSSVPPNVDLAVNGDEYLWLITIEEKKKGTLFGVYGSDEIPCEYTIELYAVNDNSPSPCEGEFTVAGKIHVYWDVKEDYDLPDVDHLEFESDHVIQPCTFRLVPNDLAPLTQDPDPLLQGSASAEFLMPTKGDNPANFSGAAQGYEFGQDLQLDMAATCKIIKTNSEVELITDVFGSFNGKIERLEAGKVPSEIELAPLTP